MEKGAAGTRGTGWWTRGGRGVRRRGSTARPGECRGRGGSRGAARSAPLTSQAALPTRPRSGAAPHHEASDPAPSLPSQGQQADEDPGGLLGRQLQDHLPGHDQPGGGGLLRSGTRRGGACSSVKCAPRVCRCESSDVTPTHPISLHPDRRPAPHRVAVHAQVCQPGEEREECADGERGPGPPDAAEEVRAGAAQAARRAPAKVQGPGGQAPAPGGEWMPGGAGVERIAMPSPGQRRRAPGPAPCTPPAPVSGGRSASPGH